MKNITQLIEDAIEVRGYINGYNQSIDTDQIAHEGVAAYDKYILIMYDGEKVELLKEEMQKQIDKW